MRIDIPLLEKYGACQEGIDYIKQHYPDGVEIEDIAGADIPKEFFFWAWNKLPLDEKLLALYNEKMELENCESIFNSFHCKDSKLVSLSEDVLSSAHIKRSKHIDFSVDVKESEFITRSSHIWHSKSITDSHYCFECSDVQKSIIVARSVFINDCLYVFNSTIAKNCIGLNHCEKATNSMFCASSKNLNNCLFCYGLNEGENLVFNEPCDPDFIEMFKKAGEAKLPESSATSQMMLMSQDYPHIYPSNFSSEFWDWARRLPGFSEDILYNTTGHFETK